MNRSRKDQAPHHNAATGNQTPAAIDSSRLFPAGQNTVFIEHGGQRYTLRLTKENKLILTK